MFNLDPDFLRSFLAISETGSYGAAAGRVNKTQSTISAQMKRLEDVLGVTLFEKNDNFQLKLRYEKYLFKKNGVSTFELSDGKKINGKIQGVSNAGNLYIEHDDGIVNEYGFKEVKLLY